MDKQLIFDLGFYNGDTSLQYLRDGFKVIGVDCNPRLKFNNSEIEQYLKDGLLKIEKKCITEKDNDIVNFYVQPSQMVWSSANIKIAERLNKSECYKVETITLSSLIEKYGTPIYCKIDIEGNDVIALKSLFDIEEKPLYVSCETECIGNENPYSIDGLENINVLNELGYKHFFLVKQIYGQDFHFDINGEYNWKTYEEIVDELRKEREKNCFSESYNFWWDVYATF